MSVDVLAELIAGSMSEQDVERMYESVISSPRAADTPRLLGLSEIEWAAFAHGVGFAELARWRRDGWPDRCWFCARPIVVREWGWMVTGPDEAHVLAHIPCMPEADERS